MVTNSRKMLRRPMVSRVGSPWYLRSCGASPIEAIGKISVSSPISVIPSTTTDAPIRQRSPMRTSGTDRRSGGRSIGPAADRARWGARSPSGGCTAAPGSTASSSRASATTLVADEGAGVRHRQPRAPPAERHLEPEDVAGHDAAAEPAVVDAAQRHAGRRSLASCSSSSTLAACVSASTMQHRRHQRLAGKVALEELLTDGEVLGRPRAGAPARVATSVDETRRESGGAARPRSAATSRRRGGVGAVTVESRYPARRTRSPGGAGRAAGGDFAAGAAPAAGPARAPAPPPRALPVAAASKALDDVAVRSIVGSAHTRPLSAALKTMCTCFSLATRSTHRIQLALEVFLELLLQRLDVLLRVLGEPLDVALLPLDLRLQLRARRVVQHGAALLQLLLRRLQRLVLSFSSRTFWSLSALTRSLSAWPSTESAAITVDAHVGVLEAVLELDRRRRRQRGACAAGRARRAGAAARALAGRPAPGPGLRAGPGWRQQHADTHGDGEHSHQHRSFLEPSGVQILLYP